MKNEGFILLYRKIRDSSVWQDKPFSKGQVWIDMLMMASHEGKTMMLGNEIIDLKRGQFIRTERALADTWGWGRKRVRNFLEMLEKRTKISTKVGPKGRVITILNYDEYQGAKRKKEPKRNQGQLQEGTKREPKELMLKECKKEILDYVRLSVNRYNRLCEDYGQEIIDNEILNLEDYIANNKKGKDPYQDHERAIKTWLRKKGIKKRASSSNTLINCPSCGHQVEEERIKDGKCPVCK